MTRREDWLMRLHDTIEAAAERPFSWGEHDCCRFAAACVEAMTGDNPFPAMPAYSTAKGAARAMKAAGYADLPAALVAVLGPGKPALAAGRGDIVLVTTETGDLACGVVDTSGERIAMVTPDGLTFYPLPAASRAWTV